MSLPLTVLEARQKNDQQARSLNRILMSIYNKKIKNKINTQEGESFDQLKKSLSPTIESITKRYMIMAAIRGGQAALNRMNFNDVPYFNIDQRILDQIDNRIRVLIEKFWFKVEKIETRNQQVNPLAGAFADIRIDQTGNVYERDRLNNIILAEAMALQAIVNSYNAGVVEAPRQAAEILMDDSEISKISKMQYHFFTKKDDKVCPEICAPLDDTYYEINDPLVPQPQLHNHCRCILEIVGEFNR